MTSRSIRPSISLGILAASLALVAGSAMAQGGPERPMRGPAVEQNRPPQVEGRFAEPWSPMGMAERPVPHSEFMSVIRMLRDPEAPQNLRLNGEQEQNIMAIDREFQRATREHMEKVREVAGLQGEGRGEGGRRDGRGPAGGEGPGERTGRPTPPPAERDREGAERPTPRRLTEAERERMEELRRKAPRPVEAQTKIWNELTDVQQAFVTDELEERRRIAERRRDEEMMRRRTEMRERMEEGGDRRGFRSPEAQAQRQRLGRAIQQLQQLPPEERERIFNILEQELAKATAAHPPQPGEGQGMRGWGDGDDAERQRRIERWREIQRQRENEGDGERPRRRRPSQPPEEGPR